MSLSSFREDKRFTAARYLGHYQLENKFLESSYLAHCVNPGPKSAWELDLCYESAGENFFPYPEPKTERASFFVVFLCVPCFSRSPSQ